MCIKTFHLILVFVLILTQNSKEFRFTRKIEGIGSPYYKIVMTLGTCKETVLFVDQKVWSHMVLNRVLDISFKCDNERYKISRVEIALVINNTSSYAHSEEGVGYSEFYATLYLPTHLNFVFYSLTIYTCYRNSESAETTAAKMNTLSYLTFLHKDNRTGTTTSGNDQFNDHDNSDRIETD